MKITMLSPLLALIVWSAITKAYDPAQCQIDSKRLTLYTLSRKDSLLHFPCRFKMVDMPCGDYQVQMIPGNVFKGEIYEIDTIDIKIQNGNSIWEGNTTNEKSKEYLAGDIDSPFTVTGGNMNTADLFSISKVTSVKEDGTVFGIYTAWSKDYNLMIRFQPRFANLDRYAILMFYCNAENNPPEFPAHMCGGRNDSDFQSEAERLGYSDDGSYTDRIRDKTILYHVFAGSPVEQTDQKCTDVVNTLASVCPNENRRAKAISQCFPMLYTKSKRLCAASYAQDNSMELLDLFQQCVNFVCSGHDDLDSCNVLADYFDVCSDFRWLPGKVEERCA